MNPRVRTVFHEVADLSPQRRLKYFAEHGVDEETSRQVEELLAFDTGAKPILEQDLSLAASRALAQLENNSGRCGPYRLLRLIGRGGMGLVFLAQREDGEVRQQAAVKLLNLGSDSDRGRQRFLQERQILANLVHPNIARMLDAGHREDGQPYLVMEYIDGKPIDEYCEALPVRAKVELVARVCDAVSYAHQHLVIHRDLKPSNILVGADGVPKLLDFGIAKMMDAADATATAERRLTPVYASPEQIKGGTIGPPSDIYSLAVILHKVLAGRTPFQGAEDISPSQLADAICEQEVTRPSLLQPGVDRDLDAIVMKAMRKEPEQRYATASEFGADIQAWLERRPVRARQGERWYVTRRFIRRRWAPLGVVALAMGALAAGWLLSSNHPRNAAAPFGTIRTTRLTSAGQTVKAAISPDGRYIAHTLHNSGRDSLRIREANTLHDLELVPPAPVSYMGLTFSPAGDTVYYATRATGTANTSALYRIPVAGGSPRKIKEGLDSPITFSPDGMRFAFVRETTRESSLMIGDLGSAGEQRLAYRKLPEVLDYPAWSPDGQIIACTTFDSSIASARGSDTRIVGVRVRDGSETALSPQVWGFIRQLAWLGDGSGLVMSARDQESGFFHLWYVSHPSGVGRKVTDGLNRQVGASISSDSRQMVTVEESTISSIWRADSEGRHPELVVSGANGTSLPLWTPTSRIVFEQELNGHRSIWMVDADGTHPKQLTLAGNNYNPSISADGRRLAFVSDRSGSPAVWTMDLDGGNPVMVAKAWPETIPQLSPDGKWTVYTAIGSNEWTTLWRVPSNGGRPIELSNRLWSGAAISPDGKWIAGFYAEHRLTTQAAPASIAVISTDGGEPRKLISIPPSVSTSAGIRWSPDGRQIDFIDSDKNGDNIWSLSLAGSRPRQLTQFHGDALFGFDWSRDGKQLVLSRGILARDVVLIQDAR